MNCKAAATGELVRAPANGRYVCPYCGKTLVPPTTKLRRSTRGRQMLRDMGESSAAILGASGLVGGALLGGILLFHDPVVGLSRHNLSPTPIVNVTALSQPESLTDSGWGACRRRRAESGAMVHRAAVTGQSKSRLLKVL